MKRVLHLEEVQVIRFGETHVGSRVCSVISLGSNLFNRRTLDRHWWDLDWVSHTSAVSFIVLSPCLRRIASEGSGVSSPKRRFPRWFFLRLRPDQQQRGFLRLVGTLPLRPNTFFGTVPVCFRRLSQPSMRVSSSCDIRGNDN